MSNDEETAVRERLWRLMPGAAVHGSEVPPMPVPGPLSAGPLPGGPVQPVVPGSPSPLESPTVLLPVRSADTGREPPSPTSPRPVRSAGPGPVEPEPARDADEMSPASRLPGPGAFDPGRRGVRALAVIAVLVVLGAAGWTWRSRPQVEPVAAVTGAPATPDPSEVAGDEPADAATGELVVAVAGKVRRPGLVRLAAGARVADAVDAAGGALPGVDVAMLNPARKVTDGELILVGVPAPTPAAGAPPGAGPVAGADPGTGGRVNLNTATAAQLETLPGVGPVLAQRIIEHRDRHGGFRSVSDLRQVNGIGDARYEQLKDLVTV
ncbi:helix-hairpin-helix domain-containing protein [Micromonospora sp. NPDC051296]|uniref:ComEA family DNA-binding protein n=1 Tax=Micromonospora sp. NPDC051296 TaxID=3155046 RepID=UPI00344632BB